MNNKNGHTPKISSHKNTLAQGILAIFGITAANVYASTVSSCLDDGSAGTLRTAINAAASGDTIDLTQLQCSKITLDGGELVIKQANLTLKGPGQNLLAIDAHGASRVIMHAYYGGGKLSLQGLTFENGLSKGSDGGCIFSHGDVSVISSSITGCKASDDYTVRGGAIYAEHTISLSASSVTNNSVEGTLKPGANFSGTAIGGGLSAGEDVVIDYSTLSGNTSTTAIGFFAYCSAIYARNAQSSTLVASTVDNNSGGPSTCLRNPSGFSGDVTITNSTISGNSAGVWVTHVAKIHVENSTVVDNSYGLNASTGTTCDIQSSILANNGAADLDCHTGVAGASNLIMHIAYDTTVPSGLVVSMADPLLGPLQFNGGTTRTRQLLLGSPAIGAGNNSAILSHDQRGGCYPRTWSDGGNIVTDIGAMNYDLIFCDNLDQ
jgi:hypothetical protein